LADLRDTPHGLLVEQILQEQAASFETALVKMDVDPGRGEQLLEETHRIITGPKPEAHEKCEFCLYRQNEA